MLQNVESATALRGRPGDAPASCALPKQAASPSADGRPVSTAAQLPLQLCPSRLSSSRPAGWDRSPPSPHREYLDVIGVMLGRRHNSIDVRAIGDAGHVGDAGDDGTAGPSAASASVTTAAAAAASAELRGLIRAPALRAPPRAGAGRCAGAPRRFVAADDDPAQRRQRARPAAGGALDRRVAVEAEPEQEEAEGVPRGAVLAPQQELRADEERRVDGELDEDRPHHAGLDPRRRLDELVDPRVPLRVLHRVDEERQHRRLARGDGALHPRLVPR
eukprot:gene2328-biopygen3523